MDLIESVKYNGVDDHGWTKVASRKRGRKQKSADPAANKNLAYSDHNVVLGSLEEQAAGDVKDESSNLKAEETELKPDHWEVSLAKAAAKIGPSDLAEFIVREPDPYPSGAVFRLATFMDYYEIAALPEVPCPWREMFKESDLPNLFHMLHVPLSYIPEPVYQTSVDWLDQQVADTEILDGFILWSFNYILCDMFLQRGGVFADDLPLGVYSPGDRCKSEVSIFVTLAMIVRSKPHLFTRVLPHLWSHRAFRGRARIPLTIWLIAQASKDHFPVGLYSWARNLLPLVPTSNPQSRDAILKLVEKILAKPYAETILVNAPVWEGERLIPPHSFKILLQLTFPNTSAREEATSRFQAIYPLLKKVALASTSGSEAIKQIFTISLRLAGERENPVLAKEATAIAIWSLTKIVDCWKHWENIYEQNLRGSAALIKKLVGQCKDSTLGSKAMIQQIFTFSLKLAGERAVLPQQATAVSIWSLTIIVDCCKHWDNLYEENLKACVALLKKLVQKWKDHSLKLSPGSKAMKHVTQKIFTLSLKLAKEGNPALAKEATSIAIWSLTENVDCCKSWGSLYKENLKASVALLEKLVDEWKDHSLKLSSSPSDTLTLSQTMKIFMLKNKNAITEGGANASLYKEADKSCKVISGRLSRGSGYLKGTVIIVVVLAAALVLAFALFNIQNFKL